MMKPQNMRLSSKMYVHFCLHTPNVGDSLPFDGQIQLGGCILNETKPFIKLTFIVKSSIIS